MSHGIQLGSLLPPPPWQSPLLFFTATALSLKPAEARITWHAHILLCTHSCFKVFGSWAPGCKSVTPTVMPFDTHCPRSSPEGDQNTQYQKAARIGNQSFKNSGFGPVRCPNGKRCLRPRLTTQACSMGFTRWREETASHKLSFDLHMYGME